MSAAIYKRACSFCKTFGVPLKICGKCKDTRYCSVECQKKDWKKHKKMCENVSKYGGPMSKIDEISRHVATIGGIFDIVRASMIFAGTLRVAVVCLVNVRENGTFTTDYGADTVITDEKIDELCRTGTISVRDRMIGIDRDPEALEYFRQSIDSMFERKSIPIIVNSKFHDGSSYVRILGAQTET